MPRLPQPHKHRAAVAVIQHLCRAAQRAPAGDQVVFVAVVFDVWDAALRGGGREGEVRVVEVGGCGAEGVDLLTIPPQSQYGSSQSPKFLKD